MKIEFLKNEPYCRYNNIIMSEENCEKLYGYPGEFDILDENTYCIDGIIYTDLKFKDLIKILGRVNGEVEEYDTILSQGRGFSAHNVEKKFENTVVISLNALETYEEIKPFRELIKDHPNLNIDEYIKFMDALDEYYK